MGSYDVGSIIENVPVLKFMEYDKVVVLLDGRPEEARIDGTANNYNGGQIYHITAPSGTVADIKVEKYGNGKKLTAKNIRIQ